MKEYTDKKVEVWLNISIINDKKNKNIKVLSLKAFSGQVLCWPLQLCISSLFHTSTEDASLIVALLITLFSRCILRFEMSFKDGVVNSMSAGSQFWFFFCLLMYYVPSYTNFVPALNQCVISVSELLCKILHSKKQMVKTRKGGQIKTRGKDSTRQRGKLRCLAITNLSNLKGQ